MSKVVIMYYQLSIYIRLRFQCTVDIQTRHQQIEHQIRDVEVSAANQTDHHRDNAQGRDHDAPGHALSGGLRNLARLETFCAGDDLNYRGNRHKDGAGVEEVSPLCAPRERRQGADAEDRDYPGDNSDDTAYDHQNRSDLQNFCPLLVIVISSVFVV